MSTVPAGRRVMRQAPRAGPRSPASSGAPRSGVIAAMAAVYIIWGSTYFAIRLAIDTLPPLLMASVRFLIAGTAMYLWALRRGDRNGDRPTAAHWRAALIIGGLLLGGGNGFVSWGEQYVSSGIAALLVASVPLWMALFGYMLFRERLSRGAGVGIALGLIGVAVLVRPGTAGSTSWVYTMIVLAAPLCWAAGSLYARGAALPRRQLVATGMHMIAGGAVLGVGAIATGDLARIHVHRISVASALAFLYLIIFGSLIAFSAYVWLLRVVPSTLVSTYAYVNPLVAVALGSGLLGEPLTWPLFAAGALIVVAVALILLTPAAGHKLAPSAQT